jgi:hypothetical protein
MPAKVLRNSSLFDSDAKYIVHQCNCVTWRAAHLAKDMFDRYPYADVYSDREKTGHQDTPGDIIIRGNGDDERYVIALLGQKFPGKPRAAAPEDWFEERKKYFFSGLQKIAKVPDLESVAFPWGIGCGAAGGDWHFYHKLLDRLAVHLDGKASVIIHCLE